MRRCEIDIRRIGFLGIGAWVLFWSSSIVLGAARPSYSHVVNTLSELGAVGMPNAVLWNVFGFIVPGIALAIVGPAVAGQGLMPAEMVDGVANAESSATRAHLISSLVSGPAWATGVLLLFGPMKRDAAWRGLHLAGVILVLLTLTTALALRGTLPDGLAQRIGNSFYCAWYILMSLRLVRIGAKASVATA